MSFSAWVADIAYGIALGVVAVIGAVAVSTCVSRSLEGKWPWRHK